MTRETKVLTFGQSTASEPIRYLRADDARRILEAKPGETIAVNGLYSLPTRSRESGMGYLGSPKYFTREDLVVTRAERDRFEKTHGFDTPSQTPGTSASVQRLLKLCHRFPNVVRAFRTRYASRGKMFDITDEYDMQDLLYGLLQVDFEDIKPEDPVPHHAGGSSRADFALRSEEILVELKMTREKLRDKEVGEQLTIDIERYRAHPKCRVLVCLVYDPGHHIRNPRGLETDLSGTRDGIEIHVLIVS